MACIPFLYLGDGISRNDQAVAFPLMVNKFNQPCRGIFGDATTHMRRRQDLACDKAERGAGHGRRLRERYAAREAQRVLEEA